MSTNFEKIRKFHRAFNHPDPDKITVLSPELLNLRINLIIEEVKELVAEFGFELKTELVPRNFDYKSSDKILIPSLVNDNKLDIPNIAKELADILYVVYGMGSNMGLPMDKVYAEVHRSNMSKLGEDGNPILREDGKILKGPNYSLADIKSVLYPEPAKKTVKPTIDIMRSISRWEDNDEYEEIKNNLIGTWRHGTVHELVVKRINDNTLWAVCYRTDKDGDYNDLRDGELSDSDVYQVKLVEKSIISYEPI